MPSRAEVRMSGFAYRIKASDLKRDFDNVLRLRTAILQYAQTMLTQVSQLSACNCHHNVYEQLTRWLLLALDRAQSDRVCVTHQSIANMLGVRREGVTEAMGILAQAGIISNTRGRIMVLDRKRLEAACCECYGIVSEGFARLRERILQLGQGDDGRERHPSSTVLQKPHYASSNDAASVDGARGD